MYTHFKIHKHIMLHFLCMYAVESLFFWILLNNIKYQKKHAYVKRDEMYTSRNIRFIETNEKNIAWSYAFVWIAWIFPNSYGSGKVLLMVHSCLFNKREREWERKDELGIESVLYLPHNVLFFNQRISKDLSLLVLNHIMVNFNSILVVF